MTAPLFHLHSGVFDGLRPGDQVRLGGSEGHHAATVMRLGVGEQIQLSDTVRTRVTGEVSAAEPGELTVDITEVIDVPQPVPHVVLVQALAKDKRDLQAVESATELGVDRIIPWEAERSVARWKSGREAKKHAEWVSTVASAAKQTRRTAIPQVEQLHTSNQYISRISAEQRCAVVVLDETQASSLAQVLRELGLLATLSDPAQARHEVCELHLVVGPEGGISPTELDRLTAAGALPARLGTNVLRSSTAGPAAIAGTQLLLGRWESAAATHSHR